MNALRPFLSRILAALLAGGCTWLAVHYGINIDLDTQKELAETIVGVIMLYVGTYATTHRLIDKRVNPADTASSHLATAGKAEVKAIKKRAR